MKRSIIFLLTFTIFSLLCASCSDLASDAASFGGLGTAAGAANGGSGGTAAAQKYLLVTGSVAASGAFPEEIAAALNKIPASSEGMTNSPGISKSAFPSLSDAYLLYLNYKITAVKVGDESVHYDVAESDIKKDVAAASVSYSVSIPVLDSPVTYKIKCEAYQGDDAANIALAGESESFAISRDKQAASADVKLGAVKESGATGGVDLTVAYETGEIDFATVTIGGVDVPGTIISGAGLIDFRSAGDDPTGVPCGAHLARFSFKKGSEEVYAFTQVVNVFKNLWTSAWVQNGAEPYFNTTVGADGKKTTACALTAAMLESWTLTEFFVDQSRSSDPTNPNYSSQSGSFLNPCLTFDAAVSKLVDSSKDYTIYINGTVTGAQTVPNTIQAKTLTICGANGLYTSGENAGQPKDTLKYQSQGLPNSNLTTLSVWTTVPVSIKNLKITGGYGREIDGNNTAGGILVGVSSSSLGNVAADVTLLDGTLVTGNEATFGGGVCLMNGSLKIKGAVISGNSGANGGGVNIAYGSSAIFYSGSIESNTVNDSGGGVCLGGSLEMRSEAVIKQNQAKDASSNWGGGVYVSNGASLTINGGEISANSGSDGGGVYNDGGSVAFNSGLIKSNSAAFYGGGVCNSSGSFDMKDGASITQNSTDDKGDGSLSSGGGVFVEGGSFAVSGGTISANTTNGKGGAVYMYDGTFSMSGSASIPYGEEKSNDVYLEFGQAITVAGELTATVPVATITPQEYADGTPILSLAEPSSTSIPAERVKFKIKQTEQLDIFDISNTGYLTTVMFSFDETFTNGTVYGTETYEGKKYAVIKYRYTQYNNLFMNVTNPYADIGWDMEFKLDDVTTDPASAATLSDGYHTLSATLAKGSESVTAVARVRVRVKPVKVQISGTVHLYGDTRNASDWGNPYFSNTMFVQAENSDGTDSEAKACFSVGGQQGINKGNTGGDFYATTYSDKNYVWLTDKSSTFYFYAGDCYSSYKTVYLGTCSKGNTGTTRTLSDLKSNKHFDSGTLYGSGSAYCFYQLDVSCDDSVDPPAP